MLGKKIRSLRKSQKLKLNDIANDSGLSVSYISQLERGLVEPSLSSLKKVAKALKIPVYLLIDDSSNEDIVTRKDDRPKLSYSSSDTTFEIASTTFTDIDFVPKMMLAEFTIPKNGTDSDGFLSHSQDEIILITEGEIEVEYGEEIYDLYPGDSIYIKENIPHRILNKSDTDDAKGYYVVSPPHIPIKN